MYRQMKAIEDYRENKILTAPPERLLLLLFEGLISHVNRARMCIEDGDAHARRTHLRKGRDICTELIASLDHDIGGEIAINLYRLYMYVNRQLIEADVSDQVEPLDNALRVLKVMESSWQAAVDQVQTERANDIGDL